MGYYAILDRTPKGRDEDGPMGTWLPVVTNMSNLLRTKVHLAATQSAGLCEHRHT
jgi:hypothetical protein